MYIYIKYIYVYIYTHTHTHKCRYRYVDIMSHSSEKYLTPVISSSYSPINSFAPLWEKILSNPFYYGD